MARFRHAVLAAAVLAAVAGGPSSVAVDGQGAVPPILLVVNSAGPNPFGGYLAEILRTEGINAFATAELSSVTAATLTGRRLTILAETPLTASQASMFSTYVANGGRLVAMRPDAQLYSTLGISAVAGTTANGYALVNQTGPGAGLHSMTLPFKGSAAHYALTTATTAATLYSTSSTSTGRPAVAVGARTAAWAFDLARSVAYVRQGDPAFANVDDDPIPVNRTIDIFYGRIDVDRVQTPHADVQMRLFSRVIDSLLADSTPLPRLWYFPGTARTLVLPTADSHTSTLAPFNALLAAADTYGARLSLYLSRYTSVPATTVDQWRTDGHEVGLHPFFSPDGFEDDPNGGYTLARSWWESLYGFPYSPTTRHHSLEWTGWVDPVSVMTSFGIRMDTSFYTWGPAVYRPTQATQAHGYINGSGLPMRMVAATGAVLPVYQQVTALVDEQLVTGSYSEGLTVPQAVAVSRQIIDESEAGGHSAVMTQFHVDYYQYGEVGPWVDGTMAYAQSLQIPMWTTQRWLGFVEARAATTIANVAWSAVDRTLTFTAQPPAGSPTLTLLVPATFGGDTVNAVAIDGEAVSAPAFTVNGRTMRAIPLASLPSGAARSVAVLYSVPTPEMSIGDGTVTEGHAGTTVVNLPVTLSSPSSNPVSVTYQTVNGTATAPGDYQSTTGTVNFAAFQTAAVIPVSVQGDASLEANETFSVTLGTPSNATLADGVAIVTIADDDAPPTITIGDASVTEGHAGTTPASFSVTLSHASASTVTVAWATANGSATAGSDYTAGSGSLTFNPGVTTLPIVVAVIGEQLAESTETFSVNLTNPTNGVIGDGTGTGTIVNDDTGTITLTSTYQVQAGVDDVNEDGANFTPDGSTVWVGSGATPATSYAGFRFTNVSIPAGATVSSARLELRSASGQWLSVAFEMAAEAAANSAPFSAASRPSQRAVLTPKVNHASDQQWLADTWYQLDQIAPVVQAAVNQSGWASGNALSIIVRGLGQSWARKFATAFEGGAAFAPRLVVTYSYTQGGGGSQPNLSVSDVTVAEGQTGLVPATFVVQLSASSTQTVTANYAAVAGSATAGQDFAAASGTVTFAPGVTSQPVTVDVLGDALDEANETFTLVLSAPVNATIGDGSGLGTITDDDATPSVAIGDVTKAEGNSGTSPATFTLTLSAASGRAVTVNYATANGTASSGSDYVAASGTVTFAAGTLSQVVSVTVNGDTTVEANETFVVNLTAPVNATVSDAQGVATLTNDDSAPVTITVSVLAGVDDVNEDGTTFTPSSTSVWLGTGSSTAASFTGLRFVNVPIPAGATITSAKLEGTAASTYLLGQSMAFQYAMEASANSAAFSSTARPSQRALLAPRVNHSSNTIWFSGTAYRLDEIAPLLQAAIAQPGWASGNAMSLILKGTGSSGARKNIRAYEAGASSAPRLVITYQVAP